MVARGKRSEPLVRIGIIGSPEGAKEFDKRISRPSAAYLRLDVNSQFEQGGRQ